MSNQEQVLVVPRKVLEQLGTFQGFCAQVEHYVPTLLAPEHLSFRPRGQVEQDPNFKQLIPYVLFCWRDEQGRPWVFHYRRGSGQGERRLHALRSVGVGGHINPVDTQGQDNWFEAGQRREIEEEVEVGFPYQVRTVGLINDDETPVGRVHLGVVGLAEVPHPQAVRPREKDMLQAGFAPTEQLLQEAHEFETWSQICLRALFEKGGLCSEQAFFPEVK